MGALLTDSIVSGYYIGSYQGSLFLNMSERKRERSFSSDVGKFYCYFQKSFQNVLRQSVLKIVLSTAFHIAHT